MNGKLTALMAVSLIIGAGLGYTISLAHISVLQAKISNSQREYDELEKTSNVCLDKLVEIGYFFLENNLWNETKGAYQVTPSDFTYYGDDNYLAYIFHTEYPKFKNHTKANMIESFLQTNPDNLTLGKKRWIVLSSEFSLYETYNDYTSYADWNALDGIFFARTNDKAQAEYCLNMIILHMYNASTGLLEDNATEENGHEYYKIALSLILAHLIGNTTYVHSFTRTLIQLQRTDGSWLTDDKDLEITYPNTETTILVLLALEHVRDCIDA